MLGPANSACDAYPTQQLTADLDEYEACAGFDLLGLFDRIVLPSAVLTHLDVNTRKILRVCCKRLRAEVDGCITSLLVNRYNISKLAGGPPGSLALRYPSLCRLAFGANEPRDVASLLRTHLPSLAPRLACLDLWGYYASVSADLWDVLVQHCPPALTLRLNLNESLLRRMEVDQVCAALAALRAGRPGLAVEFNAAHSFFGFRATDADTLSFLRASDYIRSLGFSFGLQRGRELQNERFFAHLAAAPPLDSAVAAAGAGAADVAGAVAWESLSLTHYEAEERPPVGPLLSQLHLLRRLTRLTLDCEISLLELGPLAACSALTRLTIDLLVAAPRAATAAAAAGGAAARRLPPTAAPPAPTPLPQVTFLTLGAESHPATPLGGVFPGLTELVSEPATRRVGVYNVFHCGLMLSGGGGGGSVAAAAALSCLTRLTLTAVLSVEAPSALAAAAALTALEFTHADNASTAGLLAAAALLPALRRLALWDHEDADEYLSLRPLLQPPPRPAPGGSHMGGNCDPAAADGGGGSFGTTWPPVPREAPAAAPLVLPFLEQVDIKATSPEFFEELLALLAPSAGGEPADPASADAAPLLRLGPGRLAAARLDACFDPPLLHVGCLRRLLAALGPQLRSAVVSGWATPGSEVALLSLGRTMGRPGLRVEYEYPIL